MSLVEVSNLNAGYGDIQVLYEVSLNIEAQSVVSVVGSNGAGKTTILNTISGLLRPISGEIRFDGIRIDQTETHHIVRYGIIQVPEGRGLFQNMTVLENLKLGAINPEAKKDFSESLGYVLGLFPILEQRRNQMAGTLSGGEQQMLALGRGLMAKPKLLMMDEPSLGLAPLAIKSVFESIDMLSQKGLTILLVEQNVYHSLSRCDQGYVLQNGRILLAGPGRDILENDYVKKAYLGM